MVVQHNMQAMNANRMLNITTGAQSKSTEKLSSGYRINRAVRVSAPRNSSRFCAVPLTRTRAYS